MNIFDPGRSVTGRLVTGCLLFVTGRYVTGRFVGLPIKLYLEVRTSKFVWVPISKHNSNIITINVPLFKKMRDIIFFAGQ